MSFPRYEEYKDSGIEWLTEIPKDWRSLPIKHVGLLKGGAGFPHNSQGVVGESLDFHKVNALSRADAGGYLSQSDNTIAPDTAKRLGAFVFPPETIVFAKVGAALLLARIRVIRKESCIDNNMMGLIVHHELFDMSFVRYALELVRFDLIANPGAVPSLNEGQIGNFRLPIPSNKREQHAIVSFLDRETSKIDALVSEQRRLVELLKEKRQAVISHAVTKGLDPTVPMKPSGIDWLGDVPAHWEVGKVKHYFITCSGGTPNTVQQSLYYAEEGQGHAWVRTTDLNNDFVTEVPVYITDQAIEDTACSILPEGTVMVAMYGGDGTVGKNGLLMFAAAINQAVCGLLPSESHDAQFVLRFMQFYRPYWMIGAESSRKDPNISQERVRNAPFLRPPHHEQLEIIDFLNGWLKKYDPLIGEAERSIALLQERRTALISAAVTGKIDVRGWVPEEPE
jgi:type I restriction enzyme S subunit